MAYSFITFAQAKTALAQRLTDLTKQFWTDTELGSYISESLQSFNALANFYRQEFIWNSQANVTWYDLTDSSQLPNTLRPITETDTTLIQMMEYHLLEPLTASYPLTWTGSLQFSLTDILNALQQVRDEILSETGCTLVETTVAAVPGRIYMNQCVLDLRRVCWIPTSGFGYSANLLLPSDLWAQQAFEASFPQLVPGIPKTYRRSTEPPLAFDVDRTPIVPGQYDLLTVNAGSDLSTTAARALNIPNDWCWVAKWGALAQLLGREGVSQDPNRAKYCAMRYKEGLSALRQAPALLGARINNVPVIPTAITAADYYDANWQGQTPGTPTRLYYAGLNMCALSPQPTTALTSVTANVVRNMVLPAVDADYLQVGRDDVGAVLDEAQHMAMFKCGGAEFAETFPLHGNFLRRCGLYNSKLSAMSQYLEFLDGRAQADNDLHPTFANPAAAK